MTPLSSHLAIEQLIQGHIPGHALGQPFYTEQGIFDLDMDRILLRHWFCVGHASSIPRPGDFLTADLGAESVIVLRNHAQDAVAYVNVCSHRGSRLCTTLAGRAAGGRLTCPYHAWSYDLDGRLVAARQMPDGFDRGQHGLRPLPVRIASGLIFVTFADQPLNFAPAALALERSAGVHGWDRAKVCHRETFAIAANWKLAVENYMECYHCQSAHPEFARHHVLALPAHEAAAMESAGRQRAEALGIFIDDVDQYGTSALPGSEYASLFRSALRLGSGEAHESQRQSRLMGDISQYDGNTTYIDIGPLSDFLAYADHGVIYRFIPKAAQRTEMEVIWLVHEDAVEGEDYDVAQLSSLWQVTSMQDKRIVELNQAGINSRFFKPGPYSQQETYARRFTEWYLQELVINSPCESAATLV